VRARKGEGEKQDKRPKNEGVNGRSATICVICGKIPHDYLTFLSG
jgi:hypothetical protein